MNRNYEPTSNRARAAFAAVAVTITVALGVFIDTLAFHYGPDGTLAAAKAPGARLNYASSSQGSASHLVSDALRVRTGIQATHVPYKGAAPAMADVVAGHVDFMTASYGSAVTFLQSGRIRGLAISGEKRESAFPDMPTFAELGYEALSADTWIALFAPAGTPRPVLQKWSDALAEFVAMPDVVDKLKAAGFDVWFKPLPEAEALHASEVARWGKMVRDAGITMQ